MKDYYSFCKRLFDDGIYYGFNTESTFIKTTKDLKEVESYNDTLVNVHTTYTTLDWLDESKTYDLYSVSFKANPIEGIEDNVSFVTKHAYMFKYQTNDVPDLPIEKLIEFVFYS